jgi:hypothetical protein
MRVFQAFVVLSAVATSPLVVATAASEENGECGLYLAVSSTSTASNPKWGLYAGKTYPEGDNVGFGEVAVNVFNLLGNSLGESSEKREKHLQRVIDFFQDFIWAPTSSGGEYELPMGTTNTAISGAGILASYSSKLTNADWNFSAAIFREAWNEEPGVSHPGRGAYSNFYQASLTALDEIPQGMELFVNYGDNWEDNADEDEITLEEHRKIDESVKKMLEFFDKHKDELDGSQAEVYKFLVQDVLVAAIGPEKGDKVIDILPSEPDKLGDVISGGGSMAYLQRRSIDWLKSYGLCIDNIRPGPSTIPHAGRGAFANRNIKEGGLVSPVPLVHITEEVILDMHELKAEINDENDEIYVKASDEVTGTQLVINYIYGHPESTMMFFPSGAGSTLINHSKEPNAKMVWSSHPNNHKHWFDLSAIQLLDSTNQHLGLMMEIVAIKDIQEGEEVFIDYGPEWQQAWDAHVVEWEKLEKEGTIPATWPTRALDLNEEHRNGARPIATVSEQASNPYPDNVMIKCFLKIKNPENEPSVKDDDTKVRVFSEPEKGTVYDSDNLFGCQISERKKESDGSFVYTILWGDEDDEAEGITMVKHVPQKAIVFVDKPGTGDQFHPMGFRHYIGIPDDIFPQGKWRDAA